MLRAGVFGATGYTGFELINILGKHPSIEVEVVTSESSAGKHLTDIYPTAPKLRLIPSEEADLTSIDVAFLCLPHAAAAPTAVRALEAGATVIDLSADFRLKDQSVYERWYGVEHPAPDLLEVATYGLTEFAREKLPGVKLVANPGCYPTSILIPLQPLLSAGACDAHRPIIADSKSGVSGAGRTPKQNTHFVEVAGNFSPYAIGRTHRHLPEMEQEMNEWQQPAPKLIFTPHLLPVPRGILSTIYVPLVSGWDEQKIKTLYQDTFANDYFIRVLDPGQPATLAHVNYTNRCAFSFKQEGDLLIITSAIDNLIKGAAGQAVQNMNVVLGLPETAGLS